MCVFKALPATKSPWPAKSARPLAVVVHTIHQFFSQTQQRELVTALQHAGVHWPDVSVVEPDSLPLAGQTWVLTGTLEALPRSEAKRQLVELGAKVAGSVSAKTTVVVAGPGAGSKLEKAQMLGVDIQSEDDLLSLLGRYTSGE